MADGVRIKIDGESRGVERALDRTARGYRKVETSARRAAKAGGAAKGGRPAPAMGGTQRARGVAEGLSRIGGTGGGIAGQVSSSLGAGGAFAAIGIGAAAAGLALRKLAQASNEAAEDARRRVDLEHQLTDAVKSATKSANDAALAQVDTLRTLAGLGPGLAEMAAQLERQGVAGAAAGIGALARANGGQVNQAQLQAAILASRTGQVGFAEAARDAAGRGRGSSADMAAAILANQGIDARRFGGVEAMAARAGQFDPILRARGSVTAEAMSRATSGADLTSDLINQGLAIRDPEGMARAEMAKDARRTQEALQAAADSASVLAEVMSEMGYLVGLSEGSHQRRATRVAQQYRQAGVTP